MTEAETVDALLPPRSGLVVAGPPGRQGRGNRRGVALVSSAHVAHDLYQGAVPAMLPFLVAERHYGYAAVAGLTLAATFLSPGAQPVSAGGPTATPTVDDQCGHDRRGAGVALAGLTPQHTRTWLAITLSWLGIAAFHPEAARVARQAAGDNNRAMSIFTLGQRRVRARFDADDPVAARGGVARGRAPATPVASGRRMSTPRPAPCKTA